MIGLQQSFPKPSIDQWKERLKKDLKAENLDALHFVDTLENLTFDAFSYSKETKQLNNLERGYQRSTNKWRNAYFLPKGIDQQRNQKALQVLMQGADALIFDLAGDEILDDTLKDIGLEYIHTTFISPSLQQLEAILQNDKFTWSNCSLGIDLHSSPKAQTISTVLANQLKQKQLRTLLADGYSLQQCGANAIEELGFMLASAHEYLHQLLANGLTVDEAAACIHFRVGLGANYFIQIAKIRALKALWGTIVNQYKPEHGCSFNASITAQVGQLNKSAKDPYTNLLRQTTEAMSALNAGVDSICILPFDANSTETKSQLAERMALNIPLILEEESYLDKVVDPLGGSYAIELLTEQLMEKGWTHFQQLEALGGINSVEAKQFLVESVKETAKQRIEQYRSKEKTLIGVNKFDNPDERNERLESKETYLGMKFIIIENELK